jgi:hypothetical protein
MKFPAETPEIYNRRGLPIFGQLMNPADTERDVEDTRHEVALYFFCEDELYADDLWDWGGPFTAYLDPLTASNEILLRDELYGEEWRGWENFIDWVNW